MKIYIRTKKGTKTPVRDWNNSIIVYNQKSRAKFEVCDDEDVRKVKIKIGEIV